MSSFEELDYGSSALGELILRRRRPVSMPETWVYEVKLGGHFLMSSLVRDSEEALADLALARLDGEAWKVIVGGLGLGYTAAAALRDDRVQHLEVFEFLPEVIAWHERGLVPMGTALVDDERCQLVECDCFQRVRNPQGSPVDAILIDIDDGPEEVLSSSHESFYSVEGLGETRRGIRDGGVFGLWTSRPCNDAFLERLRTAFGNGDAEEVLFDNPLLSIEETNTIYLAQA